MAKAWEQITIDAKYSLELENVPFSYKSKCVSLEFYEGTITFLISKKYEL